MQKPTDAMVTAAYGVMVDEGVFPHGVDPSSLPGMVQGEYIAYCKRIVKDMLTAALQAGPAQPVTVAGYIDLDGGDDGET